MTGPTISDAVGAYSGWHLLAALMAGLQLAALIEGNLFSSGMFTISVVAFWLTGNMVRARAATGETALQPSDTGATE